ncbi:MAG TPA: tetratricopeptide repeat protein [Gammaproteobacteria bacterium]|nr:tetratricopeptide repeat protein [Gammaproteobacteria bacterium]
MSKIQLLLLGHFECLLPSGKPVTLSMRKAEVLLAYLALAPGIRHPRERLINLLWSNRGEEQARNSLRQCLSAIRKTLGNAAELALQVDRTTVSLKGDVIDVDVLEFERLASDAGFESLFDAVNLYRGEFLEGISTRDPACQEWLDSERARFKRQYVEILSSFAHSQLASRDFNAAIRSAERLVEQDPLGESAWRLLMRACHENGDRSHALQAFKRCEQALRNELDVEPETATLELREQIAANQTEPVSMPLRDSATQEVTASLPAAGTHAKASIETPPENGHRIAVLPFDNLSGDPEQEYFSDGITDSIILHLARFPGLQVKSRNSSFAFKQQIKSLGEICDALKVDYIVEGSIRRSSERVRITVQLIESNKGNQIWGKRYDADLSDLFELEEQLSRSVAATVTGQIESDLQRIALAKGAAGQQSYDLLLAGEYHAQRFNRLDNAIAIDKLNQCLQQDPDNARAHALLYVCHGMDNLERWSVDFRASVELARQHLQRAFALDPGLALVQTLYAEQLIFDGDFETAARHLDKAFAINPNDPDALAVKAAGLVSAGDFDAALQTAKLVCELDPYHPWGEWELAAAQYFSKQYQATLAIIAKARTSPGFEHIFAIAANIKLGRIDAARQTLQDFLRHCRETMLSMPRDLDEWYDYTRSYYLCVDERYNRDLIDCLVQAGLDNEMSIPPPDTRSDEHRIAVLPFDNLSGDPGQEYFSDGISESIILHLNLFPGLIVKSRNSSFAFKQQITGLGEISRELDVDYIVEGSLRKSADQIRITAQLIEAASGNQVWGKRYDAPLADLFSLEEELSRSIAATVTGQIDADLQRIALARGAADQQAYDLLLSGIYHNRRFTREDTIISIEKLNQCLAKDPDNPRAHVNLYACHLMDYLDRWSQDHLASFERAAEHAHKAIALAPESGLARTMFGQYLVFCGEFDEAARHLDRAFDINPNDPTTLATMALNLEIQGKGEAALELAEHACLLDPFHPWAEWEVAGSLFLMGEYEAIPQAIAKMRTSPGFIQLFEIAANVKLGRIDPARRRLQSFLRECRESMLSMPQTLDDWLLYTRENYPFADPQINQDIIDCLVQAGLEAEPALPAAAVQGNDLPSILVLPFTNLSGDPEQEYFSDGITESIILSLSSFNGLNVKSRHASFAFKNSAKSIDEISEELGVQYIVEGSIRKFGERVRITVQLGDANNGNQLWGKRFDSELTELFALEEEMVKSIAGTISGRIGKALKKASLNKSKQDLKSFDHLMRGFYHLEKFNARDNLIAREQFMLSIKRDPGNGEAHSMLGETYVMELLENWTADRDEARRMMRLHAEKAIELEPDNALTHAFMSEQLLFARDFERADMHADRAIAINPNQPDGYTMKCSALSAMRRHQEAIENADISMQIDPYHPYIGWNEGEAYLATGQYERALKAFRSIPHMSPSLHAQTAATLAGMDKMDEARAEMRNYLELARAQMATFPDTEKEWRNYWHVAMPFQYEEDSIRLFDLLLKAGLCDDLQDQPDKQPSIVVLPFKNMSDDPGQEYFSDGITTSMILSLGMFDGLTARSQNSSFAYKNSTKSSQEIASELEVDFLIEGSIRKSGSKLRLSVQLVESASAGQIWGKQYDAELEDILELEQELSQTVAATISGRIGHTLQQSAIRKPAKNLHSYDYLLRGLYHLGRLTARDLQSARQMIDKCLETDPDNATAHTNLGMISNIELMENWTSNRLESEQSAKHHLARALELDPENALAHAYMAEFLFYLGEYEQSEFHADRAIEINPTAAEGYAVKADLLGFTRRIDEGVPYADKCIRLDPHSVGSGWVAGAVYRKAGLYQKAIKTFRAIAHPPASVHGLIAVCFVNLDLPDEARKEILLYKKLARQEMPFYPRSETEWRLFWRNNMPYQHEEDFDDFFELLKTAGLLDKDTEAADELPSIAVLPFENMSDDPEQAFFSDGITTDIIATLSKFQHMRVISRHSIQQYKNREASITDIASEQSVSYILEGSVRKSANKIRVNAELIDVDSEQNIWSERYDRDLDDIFAVQDDITRNITLALKVALTDGERSASRSTGTRNVKAWELVLLAGDLQDSYIQQNVMDARKMILQAIELDPNYAYARVALGWTHWQEAYCDWSDSLELSLANATVAVEQSLELEPDNAEAWILASTIHNIQHEPEKAVAASKRALELEPGNAEIQALSGFAMNFIGDYEKATEHFHKALSLCPFCPNWYYLVGTQPHRDTGELEKAAELLRRGIAAEPDSPLCRFYLVDVLLAQGNETEAQQIATEIRKLDSSMNGRGLTRSYSNDPGKRDRFLHNLEKLGLA